MSLASLLTVTKADSLLSLLLTVDIAVTLKTPQ